MRVSLHDEADAELSEAAEFLEGERAGYGERFLRAFTDARDLLIAYPKIGEACGGRIRRKRVSGFRYDIIYRLDADDILILAIAHHARRPRYWRSRLR